MEIAILQHQADAPASLLADWASERGHGLDVLRVPELGRWPDPRRYGAIVSLGSDHSVQRSADAWIAREIELLRAAHAASVPVLGLCFGAQALSVALGGEVRAAPRTDIGWIELAGGGGGLHPGPWFEWHEDAFSVPPGAVELARGPAGGSQAFRAGESVGLQFHPEASAGVIAGWVRSGADKLGRNGLQAAAILRQTVALADDARRRSFALFDELAGGWSGGRPPSVQR